MTVYGMIADEMREESEAWPVELDPLESNGEARLVVVPAAWVEPADEGTHSSGSEKKKTNNKKRSERNSSTLGMDEDGEEGSFEDKDDESEDEEEVFLETVVGDVPKPTPAQGGSIHDDDEEEGQNGAPCNQM